MSNIEIAHSNDADDFFMYYPLAYGWVDTGDLVFKNIALDINSLNEGALNARYLVTAISFALYPLIYKDYALLGCAHSFGFGYGPKLLKKKNKQLKRNFKVALSGKDTTNALIFRLYYPDARITYMHFLDIEGAILNDEVDAGVLIHESILDFNPSLEVEVEIYELWAELSKSTLPLPLGGMAISRSIPLLRAIFIEEQLTKAVEIALKHKYILSSMLENNLRIEGNNLDTYLNMYASKESVMLSDEQIKALNLLFKLGYEHGEYKELINVRDHLLPREYKSLRFKDNDEPS